MKSHYINKGTGRAELTLKELDEPQFGPREILVCVSLVLSTPTISFLIKV